MIYILFLFFTFMVLVIAFYQMQYYMFFTPTFYRSSELDERFEILSVKTDDGVELEGVVYEPVNPTQTMIFFAGRSYDAVGVIEKLALAYPNIRIITFNYRSYGRSGGKISEQNIFSDSLLITQIIKKNYGDIYIAGFSLGSSIASYVASKEKVLAVFLIGAFDSVSNITREKYGLVLSWVLRYKFDNIEFVKNIDADTYLYVSEADEVTYIQNARNLKKNIKNLVYYKEFEDLKHKDLLCNEIIVKEINGVIL